MGLLTCCRMDSELSWNIILCMTLLVLYYIYYYMYFQVLRTRLTRLKIYYLKHVYLYLKCNQFNVTMELYINVACCSLELILFDYSLRWKKFRSMPKIFTCHIWVACNEIWFASDSFVCTWPLARPLVVTLPLPDCISPVYPWRDDLDQKGRAAMDF